MQALLPSGLTVDEYDGSAIEVLEQNLFTAAALPAPTAEPVVHSSPGVRHARMGFARPVC